MTLSALLYLLQIYWPFLAIAFAIGVATGWYSLPESAGSEGKH
ncbi:hypothetical protein [Pelagibacterium limicola]|nr:hypothetical protein [Pelagibacterium limicola]